MLVPQPVLVAQWNTRPLRVWIDEEGIRAESTSTDYAARFRQEVIVFADRVEGRLGYSVVDPALAQRRETADIVIEVDLECGPDTAGHALNALATVRACSEALHAGLVGRGFVDHEISHLLGLKHHACSGDSNVGGVEMSEGLSCEWGFASDTDIDAIGCVFPHPDFPR